jgi:hypothetical protein
MHPIQTRIFLPRISPFNGPLEIETAVGLIIRPLVERYQIQYFWFSRYGEMAEGSAGDTDFSRVPTSFARGEHWVSVRFRMWVTNESRQQLESDLFQLVSNAGCFISDVRDYPDLDDLASARFCGEALTPERRSARRDFMRDFLTASARLFIHMLQGPDELGQFRFETNTRDGNNPDGNTLQSVHHLFCNMTNVPLRVLIDEGVFGGNFPQYNFIGTDIYRPQGEFKDGDE